MSSVFISYSTHDADTGRQLYNALTMQGRALWMDWKSIPFTADWWEEIKDGIEASNNFVILVSPSSIASPICHLEIQYACSLNKRIIPVLITTTDEREAYADLLTRDLNELQRALLGKQDLIDLARDNWKLLSSIQWINLVRDGFEVGLAQLNEAVDTDLEYIQEHTRLLLRAKDWMRRGKTPSLLLRGDDLIAAETWLKTSEMFKPPATDDHKTYLAESRRAQNADAAREAAQRRQARNLALLVVVLMAVGIIGFLILQTSRQASIMEANIARTAQQSAVEAQGTAAAEARAAREAVAAAETHAAVVGSTLTPIPPTLTRFVEQIAEREGQIESLRLAAAASGSTDYPELAALLGIRALRSGYTELADQSLIAALDNQWILNRFTGHTAYSDGSTASVNSAAYSPDGARIVSAASDSTLIVWDAFTGEILQTLRPYSPDVPGVTNFTSADYSPDGLHIASASSDGLVRIWDAESGEIIHTLYGHTLGLGETANVRSVEYSPDGRHIVSTAWNDTLIIWNAVSGEIVHRIEGEGFSDAAYSPDGTRIVSASGNAARIWDANAGSLLRTLAGEDTDDLVSVEYSPNGAQIVGTTWGGVMFVWDAETGERLHNLNEHSEAVYDATYTLDSAGIVSASSDGSIIIWSADTGEPLRSLRGHVHTNGNPASINSVDISPDGTRIVSASTDGTLIIWAGTFATPPRTMGVDRGTNSGIVYTPVTYSPDGTQIVSAHYNGTLTVLDTTSGELIRTLPGHRGTVYSVEYSPNGAWIVSSSLDGLVKVWNAHTGELIYTLNGHRGNTVYSAAFSPDGTHIASGAFDGTIIIWDAATRQIVNFLRAHNQPVYSVAYSPDGTQIVSGSRDTRLMLWDAVTGQPIRALFGHTRDVNSVAFSPDGTRIISASADRTLIIWDAETGEPLRTLEGHRKAVASAIYSPDGHQVVSTSWDGTLIIWDADTGEPLRTLYGHKGVVWQAAYSPDGRYIVSASADGTIRIWDVDYRDFIAYACTRVFRDFTPDERELYSILDDEPTCPQFASEENPMLTPFPATSTGVPTRTLYPATWTQLAPTTATPEAGA